MKNNDNITKDVERIEALEKEIKWLRNELYMLVNEHSALVKINQQLQDNLETLRNDNLQLIEQIGGGEHRYEDVPISSKGHTIRRCKVCGEVEEGTNG